MNTKTGLGIALTAIIIIAVPSIAISQSETQNFCQELNALRHESVSALFLHFQGQDTVETAAALLRDTLPNGDLHPVVSVRFDAATAALAGDNSHGLRNDRIAVLETYPRANRCPSLHDSGLIWGSTAK